MLYDNNYSSYTPSLFPWTSPLFFEDSFPKLLAITFFRVCLFNVYEKYSLRCRKCGVRSWVHELFVWKPERLCQELLYRGKENASKTSWSELNSEGTRLFRYCTSQAGPSPFYSTRIDKLGKYCKQRNYIMASVFVTFKYRTRNPRKRVLRNEVWNPNSRKFDSAKDECFHLHVNEN